MQTQRTQLRQLARVLRDLQQERLGRQARSIIQHPRLSTGPAAPHTGRTTAFRSGLHSAAQPSVLLATQTRWSTPPKSTKEKKEKKDKKEKKEKKPAEKKAKKTASKKAASTPTPTPEVKPAEASTTPDKTEGKTTPVETNTPTKKAKDTTTTSTSTTEAKPVADSTAGATPTPSSTETASTETTESTAKENSAKVDAKEKETEKEEGKGAEKEEKEEEDKPIPGFERWFASEANPNIPSAKQEHKRRLLAAKAAKRKGDKKRTPEEEQNERSEFQNKVFLSVGGVGLVVYLLYSVWSSRPEGEEIDYGRLVQLMKDGEIVRIEVHDITRAQFMTLNKDGKEESRYYMYIGKAGLFEYKIESLALENGREEAIPIVYRTHDHGVLGVIWQCSLPLILLYFLYFKVPRVQRSLMNEQRPGGSKKFKFEKETNVTTTFKQVAGLNETKQEIMEVVDFLKSPEKYNRLGAKIPKGVLLTGPPGVGKTLLAKATAGESGVPFFSVSGSDFMEVYVGVGPARVRDLFKEARKESPCIVFIDEIDAIGRKRKTGSGGQSNSEQESTLNSILVEMDGFSSRSGVVVLAGTNRADILDKALLRPGRFDRQVALDKPPLADRIEIFQLHLKPITVHPTVKKAKIAERLAALTPGFSGADIMNTCNEAALLAARDNASHVSMSAFEGAIEKIVGGLKKGKKISAKEKRMVAYHEAGHVVVGWQLKHADPVLKVSIVPRGGDRLGYTQHLPKDKYLSTQEELQENMVKLLGGRVAEEMEFSVISTGAADDMYRVTNMAKTQMTRYGFCPEKVGHFSFPEGNDNDFVIQKPYSNKLSQTLDVEVNLLVEQMYARTKALLTEHWEDVKKVAEALILKEEVSAEELIKMLGPKPHKSVELEKYLAALVEARIEEATEPEPEVKAAETASAA